MKDLPLASCEEHVRALLRIPGCRVERKGAHVIVSREGSMFHASIPRHREVSRRLLANQLRLLGIDQAEYAAAFRKRRGPRPR